MAEFVNDNKLKSVPGPNKYDPVLPSRTSKTNMQPKWSQSKEKRFKDMGPRTPGPGSYNITSKGVEGPYYSTRPKPKINSELFA